VKPYHTVQREAQVEIIIQKSRFIGYCFPVEREEDALRLLEGIRKQHWDATHNCYAYCIGEQSQIARYSDDGEPSGTAGLPMMDVLRKKGVTNVLVVVTRYFGGILLGAGGLVRAYSKSTSEAVGAAGLVCMTPCVPYQITLDYSRWGSMEGFLRSSGMVEQVEFTQCVTATVLIKEEHTANFEKQLIERTDANVTFVSGEARYAPFPVEENK